MGRMSIDEMSDFLGRDRLEVRNLLLAFRRNPERAAMVRRGLASLCRKAGVDPDDPSRFLPPRADRLPSEGVFLGHADGSGSPVRIPLRLFQRVVLLCGAPGRGKSTLLFSMIRQLIEFSKKLVLFDFTGEHRSLCQLFGPDRLLAVSHKDIEANPWEAQGSPLEHIQDMADILWEALYMREGSTHEITQLVTELYRERGVFAGSKNFPTQDDVEKRLAKLISDPRVKPGSRRSTWLESATRLKAVFAYLPGFRAKSCEGLRRLFEKSVIIDVSELSGIPLDFFCIFIVKFLERQTSGTFPDEVERVAFFEEAHNVASAVKEKRLCFQEPYIVKCARILRKHGIGVCYVDQAPPSLSGALLSCVEVTLSFRVSGPTNIRTVQYLTGLSEDRARYLAELGDRQAIVQSGELGPAFLMNVPEIHVPPRPSPKEVRGRMAPILKSIFPEDVGEAVSVQDKGLLGDTDKPRVPGWFTPDVRKVLESVAAHPYYSSEKRAKEVGMSPAAENVARRSLMNYGVVEETARFGRGRKWFRIIKDVFVCLLDRTRRPLVLRSKLKRLPLPKKGKNKMPVGRIGLDRMSADLGKWPVQREEEGWPKLDIERNETLMVSEKLEPQPVEEDSPQSDKHYPDQILTAIEKSIEGTTVPAEEQNDDLDETELPERRGPGVKEQPAATPPPWSPYDLISQLLLTPEELTDPFGRPLPPEDPTDDSETWMP